jgi:hypothetical protein
VHELRLLWLTGAAGRVDVGGVTQLISKGNQRLQGSALRRLGAHLGGHDRDNHELLLGWAVYAGVLTVVLLAWVLR